MNRLLLRCLPVAVAAACVVGAAPASASLVVFQTYNGSYGLSTSGGGSLGNSYTVNAYVPFGATVAAAYLYQATNLGAGVQPITFNGTALTFGPQAVNASSSTLASARADVTSLVAPLINGGSGGTYGFNVGEGNSGVTDGTALAVIYNLPSLPTQTVALLDGFASVTGDTTSINFGDPLDPTASGFVADLRLGIGFSCCNQASTVAVNGTTITTNAGNDDETGVDSDGALITVGGDNDPFSPLLPSYAEDHERYDLTPEINKGDKTITINTANASRDDNIFLAALVVSGNAAVNAPPPPPVSGVPEPTTWASMISGFGMMGGVLRRRTARSRAAAIA